MRAPIAAGVALASLRRCRRVARARRHDRSQLPRKRCALAPPRSRDDAAAWPPARQRVPPRQSPCKRALTQSLHTLTVAGACGQLASLYLLAEDGEHRRDGGTRRRYSSPPVPRAGVQPALDPRFRATFLTLLLAVLAPAAALGGIARQARREATAQHAAQQDIAGALLEHTARGERARIARELHDVVAHHISMIAVQAETARLTTPGMPAAGARRLSAIGDTARAALDRDAPAARRASRGHRTGSRRTRRPQPGLGQLDDLLDEARDSTGGGNRLILARRPGRASIPASSSPPTGSCRRRSPTPAGTRPGAAVDVELHYDGRRAAAACPRQRPRPGRDGRRPAGHGLLGMRERAAAVGGRLRTGPGAGGGFLVEAALPTAARPASERRTVHPRSSSPTTRRSSASGFAALLDTQPDFAVVGDGRRRRRSGPRCPEHAAGRRADGHPDAGHGRHRGHPAASRRRRDRRHGCSSSPPSTSTNTSTTRSRRRQRVPPQGRHRRASSSTPSASRRRRRAPRTQRHPSAHQRLRAATPQPRRRFLPGSPNSPPAKQKSSSSSQKASQIPRSRPAS